MIPAMHGRDLIGVRKFSGDLGDSHSDADKMTLRCSIYIKLGAVGARRAMGYCEEQREKLHIHAPCRIVTE